MSIKYNGQTVVGPGNEVYIGKNGNFFVGGKDLGVKAGSDTHMVSKSEFLTSYKSGLYYVVSESPDTQEPIVELWYINEAGDKISVNGNKYIVPEVGENGNWFVDGTDTGKPAIIQKTCTTMTLFAENWEQYVSEDDTLVDGLYVQNLSYQNMVEGCEVNMILGACDIHLMVSYSQAFRNIIRWESKNGYIQVFSISGTMPTIPVDVIVTGSADTTMVTGGVDIDDNSVNVTTGWSSYKITDYTNKLMSVLEAMAAAKNLEFQWSGSRLGVRQQGYTDYLYKDLRGPVGLCGIDGSSIVDAKVDNNGHLWLTIQDDEQEIDTTKMLTLESGAFTLKDLLDLQNSINRINNDLAAIKVGPFRQVVAIKETTEEYKHIVTLPGCGTIQFFTTRFTGKVRITVDGDIYEGTFDDLSKQSVNNLLLPSVSDNTVIMNPKFTTDQSVPLNITFEDMCRLELIVTANAAGVLPTILIQGDYYSNGDFGEQPSEVVDFDAIPDDTIDEIFEDVFGPEEDLSVDGTEETVTTTIEEEV